MKRGTLWIVFVALCALGNAGCGSSSKKPLAVTISMAPTTLAVNSTGNVVATVTNDPANAGVIWSCTPAVACGSSSFNPSSTLSGGTSVFTAPPAIPSGGSVTITATSSTNSSVVSAPVTITITAAAVATNNFVFYASGEQNATDAEATYSIAGVVAVATTASEDGSFAVIAGEQDYNDGIDITSPQPAGDFITGGSLAFTNAAGQATLTLNTNNPAIGTLANPGTEVFALAFANNNHALIVQFDGSATSSGSYDFQSSTTAPVSTSFAFTASGVDSGGAPIADAGVFALDASSNLTGTVDVNDGGAVTLTTAIPTGTALGVADSLGRGSVTGSITGTPPLTPITLNFYVVGLEVLRLVDVDAASGDTAVGSAYGQGAAGTTPAFSAASIRTSVFSVAGNDVDQFASAGRFTTDGVSAFSGVGDENESLSIGSVPVLAEGFGGTYAVNSSGYGNFTFGAGDGLGSMLVLGVYAVDPALNILDPNKPLAAGSGGGALFAEMDASLVGTGVLIPQTDTALSALAGTFAFGAQGSGTAQSTVGPPPVTVIDEFDFLGEGAIAGGAFTGAGVLSDPFGSLTAAFVQSTNAAFSAAFVDDGEGIGRSTSNLEVSAAFTPPATPDFPTVTVAVTVYEANAGQAFWIDTDDLTDVFAGSIQSNTGVAAAAKKRAQARTKNEKR
jgi:hypothetical protein